MSWKFSFGCAFLIYGILVFASGGERFYIGVSPAVWGDLYLYISIAFIISGMCVLFLYFNNRPVNETLKFTEVILMCPKCGEPYNENDLESSQCSVCDVDLEEMEGFYSRHPEFK